MDDGWNRAGDKLAADIEKDNPPTTAEILKAARDLIADPEHWTQDAYARDEDGAEIWDATDDKACRWCADGALLRAAGGHESDNYTEAYTTANECAQTIAPEFADLHGAVISVNDERGHEAVLRMFDCAIAKASA